MGKVTKGHTLAEAAARAWRRVFGKPDAVVKSEGVPMVQMIGRGKRINPHQIPVELSAGYRLDIAELSNGGALVVGRETLSEFMASDHPAAEAHRQRVAMIRLRDSLDKRLMITRTGRGWLFYRKERVIDSGMGCLSHVKQLVTPATHIPANKRPRGKAYRRALDREVAVGWYAPQPRHEDSL